MDYNAFFNQKLTELKEEGRYRTFFPVTRDRENYPNVTLVRNGIPQQVVVWCSNDYLSLSQHPHLKKAMTAALTHVGVGAGGTRNISGTTHFHVALEQRLADLHEKESALLFSSGFVANEATLWTLLQQMPHAAVFSDACNHASIIQGIRASKAEKFVFAHNDAADLEEKLASIDRNRPKIIVFESVYSMSGSVAPIAAYIHLAKKYNALTYLDEVHTVGLYGKAGAGYAHKLGVHHAVDIIQGTLAKGFGCSGGYIAGESDLVDFVRSFSPGFIFTTSIAPSMAAAALRALELAQETSLIREKFTQNVAQVKKEFVNKGIPFIDHGTHIIPITIGCPRRTRTLSEGLLDRGVYLQPINYPTVPRGRECLRVTPNAGHTREMITHLVQSLLDVLHEHGMTDILEPTG